MFVCELDCRWSETPFPVGGFHLKKCEDIQTLQKFCKQVSIDLNKGKKPPKKRSSQLTILSSVRRAAPNSTSLRIKRDCYAVTHTIKQRIDQALSGYDSLCREYERISDTVRSEKKIDLGDLERKIKAMVVLIIASPQTIIWMLNTEKEEVSLKNYSVRAALWATILARQIGLSVYDMNVLFLGTLFADIGIQLLPPKLTSKRGHFRKKECLAYRKHVQLGAQLFNQLPMLDDRVVSIIRGHHERQDGLGFPRSLRGEQIPLLARFAHLAYSFERLLRRGSEQPVSPGDALKRLYRQRELKFPEQLVVEFMHLLGTYPVGSLVELAGGESAIVLEQSHSERLNPVVAIVANSEQVPLIKPRRLDLADSKQNRAGYRICSVGKAHLAALKTSDYGECFFGRRIGIGKLSLRL